MNVALPSGHPTYRDIYVAFQPYPQSMLNYRTYRASRPGIQLTQLTGLWPGYRHVSFRPSAAQCRNLIFSVTCLSLGDSGLPLRGNRNDGSDVGT